MKIYPIPVEPIREDECPAFVSRDTGCSGVELVRFKVYPKSPRGEALEALMQKQRLGLTVVRHMLEVTAEQLSGLQRGRYALPDEVWVKVFAMLEAFVAGDL